MLNEIFAGVRQPASRVEEPDAVIDAASITIPLDARTLTAEAIAGEFAADLERAMRGLRDAALS